MGGALANPDDMKCYDMSATTHSVTDRHTDRRTDRDDANSLSYSGKKVKIVTKMFVNVKLQEG